MLFAARDISERLRVGLGRPGVDTRLIELYQGAPQQIDNFPIAFCSTFRHSAGANIWIYLEKHYF
jgi:hypothetical protein